MASSRTKTIDSVPSRLSRVEITVSGGPEKGLKLELGQSPLLIGTAPDCDLVLTDKTVSKHHCELLRQGDQIVIRDLGSRNGVFVGDLRVREAILESQCKLRLGEATLSVRPVGEEEVLISIADHFGDLYGTSPVMRALFAQLQAIARSAAPVLVEGETGTGKDMAAAALHEASERAGRAFIVFDCGSVAGTLLEAELFGCEKGAFTGATVARPGMAAAADGGTLVIDEVGELPLELQPKLLRLVEAKEVRRLGSTSSEQVDVRIIACTNRSLKAEVKAGRFREDLYYRLSALRVQLPPVRARPEDLPGLIDRFLKEHGSSRRFAKLSTNDQSLLLSHRWPGNVRELRNAVERLVTFADTSASRMLESGITDVQTPSGGFLPLPVARKQAQEEFELRYLRDLMVSAKDSVADGAQLAGVSRQFLHRLLQKHGLR